MIRAVIFLEVLYGHNILYEHCRIHRDRFSSRWRKGMGDSEMQGSTKNKYEEIILKASEGNAGAMTLLVKMMDRPRWVEMVEYLNVFGPKGANLWELYKDVFRSNYQRFADCIEQRMQAYELEKRQYKQETFKKVIGC